MVIKAKTKENVIQHKSLVDVDLDRILTGMFRQKEFSNELNLIKNNPKQLTKIKSAADRLVNLFTGLTVYDKLELNVEAHRPKYGRLTVNKKQYWIFDIILDSLVTQDFLSRDKYIVNEKARAFSPCKKLIDLIDHSKYIIEEITLEQKESNVNGVFDYSHVQVNIPKLAKIISLEAIDGIPWYGKIQHSLYCVKQLLGMVDGTDSVYEFNSSGRITNPIIQMKSSWRQALYSKNGDLDTPIDIDMCSAALQLLIRDVNDGFIPAVLQEALLNDLPEQLFGDLQLYKDGNLMSPKIILLQLLFGKSGGSIKGWKVAIDRFRSFHRLFEAVWQFTREFHKNGDNVALYTQRHEARLLNKIFENHSKTSVACYDGILTFSSTACKTILNDFEYLGLVVKVKKEFTNNTNQCIIKE